MANKFPENKAGSSKPALTKFFLENTKHVLLNVGGEKHKVSLKTLNKFPNSRLGKLSFTPLNTIVEREICDAYNSDKKEYYFGRHPKMFHSILSFYYTGELHISDGICPIAFEEEIKYWGIDEIDFSLCCQLKYYEKLQEIKEDQDILASSPSTEEESFTNSKCGRFRKYIWKLLERPESSLAGKVLKFVSIFNILSFGCMNCLIYTKRIGNISIKLWMKFACWNGINVVNIFFLVELMVRFLVAPNKRLFFKKIFNIMDLSASILFCFIMTYNIMVTEQLIGQLIGTKIIPFRFFVWASLILVILRFFSIGRHSIACQSLLFAVGNSYQEMIKLLLLLIMAVLLLSRVVYYAENEDAPYNIEDWYWWTAVTMNIVGVGNLKHETPKGMLFSFCCGICGILVIGLPIPIIADTFTVYLYGEKRRQKVLKGFRSLEKFKLQLEPQTTQNLAQIFKSKSSFVECVATHMLQSSSDLSRDWELPKLVRPVINVGGFTHELTWNMVNRFPNARLSNIGSAASLAYLSTFCDDYCIDEFQTEFYFHRNSSACASILNFYFTGKFHVVDNNICPNELEAEMIYWMIDESIMERCCYNKYFKNKEQVSNETEEIKVLVHQTILEENFGDGVCNGCRKFIWNILEKQNNTRVGAVFGLLSCSVTFLSVCILTIKSVTNYESDWNIYSNEVLDEFNYSSNITLKLKIEFVDSIRQENHLQSIVETCCIVWFGIEYALRLFASPKRYKFWFNILNMIDPIIVILHAFNVFAPSENLSEYVYISSEICAILRILRMHRILNFGSDSATLKALVFTLKNVTEHIGSLVFFITLCTFFFSSTAVLYEKGYVKTSYDHYEINMGGFIDDLAETLWWALITMRTVATDTDIHTFTVAGKLIGFICGLVGLFFLVLPIPIMANNYAEFYKNIESKRKKKP